MGYLRYKQIFISIYEIYEIYLIYWMYGIFGIFGIGRICGIHGISVMYAFAKTVDALDFRKIDTKAIPRLIKNIPKWIHDCFWQVR